MRSKLITDRLKNFFPRFEWRLGCIKPRVIDLLFLGEEFEKKRCTYSIRGIDENETMDE